MVNAINYIAVKFIFQIFSSNFEWVLLFLELSGPKDADTSYGSLEDEDEDYRRSFRSADDWMKHWKNVGKKDMEKFIEEQRKEWKLRREMKRWAKRFRSQGPRTPNINFGRRTLIMDKQINSDKVRHQLTARKIAVINK